jgi:hypothetical protein
MKVIIGEIKRFKGDIPPNIGKIRRIKIISPYLCMKLSASMASRSGSRPINIFPPSSGCSGIRLKTARVMLIVTVYSRRKVMNEMGKKGLLIMRKIIDNITARIIFDNGPERAINAPSFFGFFRL